MKTNAISTKTLTYTALFAVLITICAWLSIPTIVPFTLQTFAVFLALLVLGGKAGTLSVIVYLLMGAVGLPVFAGMKGGLGSLLGTTGGYLLGFIALALVYWGMTTLLGQKFWVELTALILGQALCYALGTAWFVVVYSQTTGAVGFATALSWCVIPYILPDAGKLVAAVLLRKRIGKWMK